MGRVPPRRPRLQAGDHLPVKEWYLHTQVFTSRAILVQVTDLTSGYHIPKDFCMLSFRPVEAQASIEDKTVSFGHRHVTYKVRWPGAFVPVLKLFA